MDAIHRYPPTPSGLEIAAAKLAEWCNGGRWDRDYTEEQKNLWRGRVRIALSIGRFDDPSK